MSVLSTFLDKSSSGLQDRTRLSGLYVSVFGIFIVGLIAITTVLTNSASDLMYFKIVTFLSLLSVIGISSYYSYKVNEILNGFLTLTLIAFWIFAFHSLKTGYTHLVSLALILFVPVFLITILNHKLVAALAPFQAALVFLYFEQYGKFLDGQEAYSFSLLPDLKNTLSGLSVVCSVLSGISFLMYAAIGYIRHRKDLQLIELIDKNRMLASTDELTRLMNRRAFLQKLQNIWEEGEPFTLAYIDLDRFKPINDQLGHAAGDEFLRKFSNRFKDVPNIRYAARLGGDEFAIILDRDISANEAQIIVPHTHKLLISEIPTEFGLLNVGCSIGYVVARIDVNSASKVIQAAEHAMRRAKTSEFGWARFDRTKDSLEFTTSSLENEFRDALQENKIRAAIQPIVSGIDRKVKGYELLARWVDSGFSRNPSPNEFIPAAERLGLLDEVLWRTLDEALQNLNLSSKYLAINISPSQILGAKFLENLLNILERNSVRPDAITLEITEQVAFRNLDENLKILQEARELGLSIAIDDFGAGYSSFSMLGVLPLTKLKIDQSLLKDLNDSDRKQSILLTVINMSRQLGLTCCVEGVETEMMASYLTTLGVEEIQGYWTGPPSLVTDALTEKLIA